MTAEDRAITCPFGPEIAILGSRVGGLEERVSKIEQAAISSGNKLDQVCNDVSFIRGKLENGARFSNKVSSNERIFWVIVATLATIIATLLGVGATV